MKTKQQKYEEAIDRAFYRLRKAEVMLRYKAKSPERAWIAMGIRKSDTTSQIRLLALLG